jgi:tail tube protein
MITALFILASLGPTVLTLILSALAAASFFVFGYNDTSALGAAIAVEGLQIQFGNGASPEVFTSVANVADLTLPLTAEKVDVTNVGQTWKSYITTLLDMGAIKFKIFWVMTEPTHENMVSGNIRGIRYLFTNRLLANVKVIYPDGMNSTDTFPAYVTSFSITGKVGGVFEAEIELAQSSTATTVPVLV